MSDWYLSPAALIILYNDVANSCLKSPNSTFSQELYPNYSKGQNKFYFLFYSQEIICPPPTPHLCLILVGLQRIV